MCKLLKHAAAADIDSDLGSHCWLQFAGKKRKLGSLLLFTFFFSEKDTKTYIRKMLHLQQFCLFCLSLPQIVSLLCICSSFLRVVASVSIIYTLLISLICAVFH